MLFDIQSFNFTYNSLSMRQFVEIKKADDKCRLKFGRERVNKLILLGFNDTATLVGHFLSLPEKGRKEIEEIVDEMIEGTGIK